MAVFPNKDIAIEILSRLPVKSLVAFKCTSKKWNKFVSDPFFLRIHHERSKNSSHILGLFVHVAIPDTDRDLRVKFITLDKEHSPCNYVDDTSLDFLPETVIIVSSNNGLLLCRSVVHPQDKQAIHMYESNKELEVKGIQKNFAIYLCNPATREWIKVKSMKDNVTLHLGLAFTPFSEGGFKFKIVNLQPLGNDNYSFVIYSSETKKWKKSKEVCKFNSAIYPHKAVFSNGRLHWLTINHHVVTFHIEKEECKVMKLPGPTPYEGDLCELGIYLSESDGYFHYVVAFRNELYVWILKNYEEPATWELKYCLDLNKFRRKHQSYLEMVLSNKPVTIDPLNLLNASVNPLAFINDVVYLSIMVRLFEFLVISYNFKTGEAIKYGSSGGIGKLFKRVPFVHPYQASLVNIKLPRVKKYKKRRITITLYF